MNNKEVQARIKINKLLEQSGWRFENSEKGKANISLEPGVTIDDAGDDFENIPKGYIDYLLLDKDGRPLVVLEAKKESIEPLSAKEQARNYARNVGARFVILSNDLTVSAVSGTIKDSLNQAMTNFVLAVNLAANKNIVIDTVAPGAIVASVAAGTYATAQSVSLSSSGASSIRYSTASMPGDCTSGTLYSEAIAVSSSGTIYARACKSTNATYTTASFVYSISPVVTRSGGSVGSRGYYAPVIASQNPIATSQKNTVASQISKVGLPKDFQFTKDLRPLTSTSDIKNLQIFLNNNGFTVSDAGAGSKGKENNYMGLKTKAALIKFQEMHAKDILAPQGFKKGTGVFGPYSRKVINLWLQQSTVR